MASTMFFVVLILIIQVCTMNCAMIPQKEATTCSVSIKERNQCAYEGCSMYQCEQEGCCFDARAKPSCYYPTKSVVAETVKDNTCDLDGKRELCGIEGFSQFQCLQEECCYDSTRKVKPYCFKPKKNNGIL